MLALRTLLPLSRAWSRAARPATMTWSPASLNTVPTTGTSTSRIDSPVRTTATPAPSAEWVTSLTLSSARPAVHPATAQRIIQVTTRASANARRRGCRSQSMAPRVPACHRVHRERDRDLRRRLLLGRGGRVPPRRRRHRHPRRLHRRPHRASDLPPGLRAPHRPRRGGRGHLRPGAGQLRGAARALLGRPRPDHAQPPGRRHRLSVPLRDLLHLTRAGSDRDQVARRAAGPARAERRPRPAQAPPPDRHADRAGHHVLARRGLPPAVPREARPGDLRRRAPLAALEPLR